MAKARNHQKDFCSFVALLEIEIHRAMSLTPSLISTSLTPFCRRGTNSHEELACFQASNCDLSTMLQPYREDSRRSRRRFRGPICTKTVRTRLAVVTSRSECVNKRGAVADVWPGGRTPRQSLLPPRQIWGLYGTQRCQDVPTS